MHIKKTTAVEKFAKVKRGRPRKHEQVEKTPAGYSLKEMNPDFCKPLPAKQKITLTESKIQRELIKIEQEKLNYEVLRGSLIERSKVQNEAMTIGKSVRDVLLNIPTRVTEKIILLIQSENIEYNDIYDLILSEIKAILDDCVAIMAKQYDISL